jgi:hypothetical protein
MTDDTSEAKSSSRRKGCLITILVVAVCIVWGFWQIEEPDRRAKRVHQAITLGMHFRDIEPLLTGRHFCFFEVRTNSQWACVSTQAFTEPDEIQLTGEPDTMRLQFHFMGMSPHRMSFFVELDQGGNVTNVTNPYGWE